MRTLEFKLRVIDGRTGIVETDIFIIQEPREVFKGYCEIHTSELVEYIRVEKH